MGTGNQFIDSKIEWIYTSDIAKNTSTVTAKLYYRRNNTGYTTYGTGTFSLTIDGNKKSVTKYVEIGTSWVEAMSHSATVSHKDDGTKSLTISSTGSISGTSLSSTSCSDTVKLDAIPRVSEPTVSASSAAMGGKVTITTNRKSDTFTHTLTYSFGGATGTIASGVGASYLWTVPDLVSRIPGKSNGKCTITCKTYSGSSLIGTESVELTLNIPAASQPSASDGTVQMGTSVNIYTNRKSAAYTHTLSYAIGSQTDTIKEGVEAGRAWTPPKSLAAHTGNKTSAPLPQTRSGRSWRHRSPVSSPTAPISRAIPSPRQRPCFSSSLPRDPVHTSLSGRGRSTRS